MFTHGLEYKECVQRMQYYPSGLPWAEAMIPSEQPWKYNSKEFVEMQQQENQKVGDEVKYTWFDVRGDENGTKLFEFFANNTTVEWSQFMMGIEGDKGLNVILTSHDEGTDEAGRFLLMNKLQYGYTIRKHYHNHPNYTTTPSGRKSTENGKFKGDYGFATWISRYTRNKSTEYFIYVRNHDLVPYTPIP